MSEYVSIRYAIVRELPKSIEIKRENIQKEILRRTGMKIKVSLKQVQKYLAVELGQKKLAFDLPLWNRVMASK